MAENPLSNQQLSTYQPGWEEQQQLFQQYPGLKPSTVVPALKGLVGAFSGDKDILEQASALNTRNQQIHLYNEKLKAEIAKMRHDMLKDKLSGELDIRQIEATEKLTTARVGQMESATELAGKREERLTREGASATKLAGEREERLTREGIVSSGREHEQMLLAKQRRGLEADVLKFEKENKKLEQKRRSAKDKREEKKLDSEIALNNKRMEAIDADIAITRVKAFSISPEDIVNENPEALVMKLSKNVPEEYRPMFIQSMGKFIKESDYPPVLQNISNELKVDALTLLGEEKFVERDGAGNVGGWSPEGKKVLRELFISKISEPEIWEELMKNEMQFRIFVEENAAVDFAGIGKGNLWQEIKDEYWKKKGGMWKREQAKKLRAK